MAESKQFSVRVTDELAESLVARSTAAGKSTSDVIRELLQGALEGNGQVTGHSQSANGGGGDSTRATASLIGEVKPLFEQVSSAWTVVCDQMQDMATAVGQCRTEIETTKAQIKLLRRDLRTLVRTLDECLSRDGQASQANQSTTTVPPSDHDHAQH
jgi:hypothetical protein